MTAATQTGENAQPQRMTIFRASEAREGYDKMPFIGIDDSVMAGYAKIAEAGAEYAEQGQLMRTLFAAPGENGFSLTYAWFKSGFIVPRHSHNADCLYYVLGGEMHLGNQILKRGDGVFVPEDNPYSFEAGADGVEILEFRNATQFHFLFGRNDEAYWEKMASAIRNNGPRWKDETVPPSHKGG